MNNIRSLLFVPAEDKYLSKIGTTNADAYIIDLEDSIKKTNKDEALKRTLLYLDSNRSDKIFVRINKDRYLTELAELTRYKVGIVLPKMQASQDYKDAEAFFIDREVIALIESPRALLNADSIAAISWIDALAFGAEDFTTCSRMINACEYLFVPKSMLALAAKANGKPVFDTPCFHLSDDWRFEEELVQAFNLGFDGKLAIHPKQIDLINRFFNTQNIECLKSVVEQYEKAGKAVCVVNGVVYEEMHINMLKKLIAASEAE